MRTVILFDADYDPMYDLGIDYIPEFDADGVTIIDIGKPLLLGKNGIIDADDIIPIGYDTLEFMDFYEFKEG